MIELILLLLFWITYVIAEKCYSNLEDQYRVFNTKGSFLFILAITFLMSSTLLAIYNLYFGYGK